MQGTVKFFDQERGFGFITPHEPGRDVFVRIKQVQRGGAYTISEGQRVSFDVVTDCRSSGRRCYARLNRTSEAP
jgi:cold shock protein